MSSNSFMPDMDAAMLAMRNQDLVQQKMQIDALNSSLNPGKDEAAKLKESCQGFESIFIQKMWEQMRKTVPQEGYLHSKQEAMYQSMFDYEFSRKMSEAGGIGLADMMYEQLGQRLVQQGSITETSGGPVLPIVPATGSPTANNRFGKVEQPEAAVVEAQAEKPSLIPLYEEIHEPVNLDGLDLEEYSQNLLLAELQAAEAFALQNQPLPFSTQAGAAAVSQTMQNPAGQNSAGQNQNPAAQPEVVIEAPVPADGSGQAQAAAQGLAQGQARPSSAIQASVKPVQSPLAEAAGNNIASMLEEAGQSMNADRRAAVLAGRLAVAEEAAVSPVLVADSLSDQEKNLLQSALEQSANSAAAGGSASSGLYADAAIDGPLVGGGFSAALSEFTESQSAVGSASGIDNGLNAVAQAGVSSSSPAERRGNSLEMPLYTNPVDGPALKPFGWAEAEDGSRAWHQGVDYAAIQGEPVRAAMDGRIIFAGEREGYGQLVIVEHADGWRTFYGNSSLQGHAVGDSVTNGTAFATIVADREENSTHLHFELRRGELALNPLGSVLLTAER